MKTRQLVITAALLAMTSGVMAQNVAAPAGGTVNGATSPDPYVQKRQADADAKAEYKAEKKAANQKAKEEKKAANQAAKAEKKAAKQELKEQKRAATAERNAELAKPQAPTDRTP